MFGRDLLLGLPGKTRQFVDGGCGTKNWQILDSMLTDWISRDSREHPDKQLLLEVGDDAPDEVRHTLDHLTQLEPRLNCVVQPRNN